MYDIVVLGAGVVGLSTALNIQALLPASAVTIVADKFTTETTSDGAAGIFRPSVEKTPVRSVDQFKGWCKESFDWYHRLNRELDPAETGVLRVTGYHFSDTKTPYPVPHEMYYEFRELTEKELKSLPGNNKNGWQYTTLMVECRRYLPWMTKRFVSNGGRLERRKISSLDEFAGRCNVLVNCSGMESAVLMKDTDMFPVRGHLLRVKAPWIKHFYVWDDASSYIYPGQDNVVLGGTRQKGEYDITAGEYWFDDIIARCERLFPGIKNAKIETKWIGLRPHRSFIRLEADKLVKNGQILHIVHNYGHGANGVALSWGTGVEAAQLVRTIRSSTAKARL